MNQSDISSESLLASWMQGTLSDEEKAVFSERYKQDPEFAKAVDNAKHLMHSQEQFTSPQVPSWDKLASFKSSSRTRWYQWQGFPVLATAFSVCALVVMVSGVHLSLNEQGVTLRFASTVDEQAIEQLVNEKVERQLAQQRELYQQANQRLFKEYAQALSQAQQQSNVQLTQYLLESSRKERKEDFAQLIQFINEQRIDDQRFYARQFNKIQDEIDDIGVGYSVLLPTTYSESSNDQ